MERRCRTLSEQTKEVKKEAYVKPEMKKLVAVEEITLFSPGLVS